MATGPENARDFACKGIRVADMFEYLSRINQIELTIQVRKVDAVECVEAIIDDHSGGDFGRGFDVDASPGGIGQKHLEEVERPAIAAS
jgi:hypothetical protein